MKNRCMLTAALSILLMANLAHAAPAIFQPDNLVAWCIVPYDNQERTSLERAQMLNRLGLSRLAWDWRAKHVPLLEEEIRVLQDHDISLDAVWIWLDQPEYAESFGQANDTLIRTVGEAGVRTTYWVSFSDRHLEGMNDVEKLDFCSKAIGKLADTAARQGSRVALYNHGAWFGHPRNQVRIIKKLDRANIGIVYNFHHAHEELDEFPQLLELMLPHLYTMNLNGMTRGGPKIQTIGEGESEEEMIRLLAESGFSGTVGILCHIMEADAEKILRANMDGLRSLVEKM
jgi:sugar phosphate isomerase/epimerase